MITFPVGEGTAPGYFALPKGGEGPGILVLHAWRGLNDFFKEVCERTVAVGYCDRRRLPELLPGMSIESVDPALL